MTISCRPKPTRPLANRPLPSPATPHRTLVMDKYQLEDLILAELRKQSCFVRVSDIDVGHVLVSGVLDLGRLAENLCEKLPLKSPLPPR